MPESAGCFPLSSLPAKNRGLLFKTCRTSWTVLKQEVHAPSSGKHAGNVTQRTCAIPCPAVNDENSQPALHANTAGRETLVRARRGEYESSSESMSPHGYRHGWLPAWSHKDLIQMAANREQVGRCRTTTCGARISTALPCGLQCSCNRRHPDYLLSPPIERAPWS